METYCLTVGELASHGHNAATAGAGAYTPTPYFGGAFINVRGYSASVPNGIGFQGVQQGYWSDTNIAECGINTIPAHTHDVNIEQIGNNEPHNNIQPYNACYIWLRVS